MQRFSLHDGPGIRTTVFFKGCPLHCAWCQNPESIDPGPGIFQHPERCLGCDACLEQCPEGAIAPGNQGAVIDRGLCTACLECAKTCPAGALEAAGKKYTLSALVAETLRDRFMFDSSGGGVTCSGGEPLQQPVFLRAFLSVLREEGVHTVLDTSGYAPWPVLKETADLCDLVLYDLKLLTTPHAEKYTGVASDLIVDNFKKLARSTTALQARLPLVPTITDQRENLQAVAGLLEECAVGKLELVSYHRYGQAKYRKLGLSYSLTHLPDLPASSLEKAKALFEARGITIQTGDD